MNIDPTFLELSFDNAGVRNSQRRLKQLISTHAVDPLKAYQEELRHKFSLVEDILAKRIAATIIHWLQYKHDPVKPDSQDMMSTITNSTKNDMTLEAFYHNQIKDAMYSLAPLLGLEMPDQDQYSVETEELEYALIELEDRFERDGGLPEKLADQSNGNGHQSDYYDYNDYSDFDYTDYEDDYAYAGYEDDYNDNVDDFETVEDEALSQAMSARTLQDIAPAPTRQQRAETVAIERDETNTRIRRQNEKAIVVSENTSIEKQRDPEIQINMLNISAEQAWRLTYELMGYTSDYVQQQMLPRWQQYPDTFDKDRRFLYQTFIETLRNAAGAQVIAGNSIFADRTMTVDQLWNHYFADLSQNVGPQLAVARLEAAANDPRWKKWFNTLLGDMKRISPVWVVALTIALIFDGLTTYVSLDQTPMEGFMVVVFTILITALFQIADMLVISYRKKEFEAEALAAKYQAQSNKLQSLLSQLDTTSDSYVQTSMQKSQAHADWKAVEDNRKMARRGRFWSARIADINVVVTAYGFAFMFLNAQEPMYALWLQIETIRLGMWGNLNLWVFLMIGLAITVSFVINTAQRTEILGWSMRRLKNS